MFVRLDGIPEPPAGYVPPLGASRSTWTNIYKNKGRIDYCVQQFEVQFFIYTESLDFGFVCDFSYLAAFEQPFEVH